MSKTKEKEKPKEDTQLVKDIKQNTTETIKKNRHVG